MESQLPAAVLFGVGFGLVAGGVALVSVPAGLVAAGVLLVLWTWLVLGE